MFDVCDNGLFKALSNAEDRDLGDQGGIASFFKFCDELVLGIERNSVKPVTDGLEVLLVLFLPFVAVDEDHLECSFFGELIIKLFHWL